MTGRMGCLISLFAMVAGLARPVAAQAGPSPAAVDSVFAAYDHTTTPGCALGVYRDGAIVYQRGYGMADLNQGVPITPETVFYIASTSKQFAAFAIALLAEEGRISLDDPVRRHVPELPAYADAITIRHLVHHTSGLRDYLGLWGLSGRSFADRIPEEQALALIAGQRATNFPPGSEWSYSNSGYFLLSLIVKRVTGSSLAQYSEEKIFGPLGMAHTHFHDDGQRIVPRRAEGYQGSSRDGFSIVRTSFDLVGDGGLLTTVGDLLAWDSNFYRNRLGRGGQGLIDLVTTPGTLTGGKPHTYAFGLMRSSYRGLETVAHGGSFIGFRAALTRFPAQRFSVAVLCNDAAASADGLALRVADLFLADKLAPRPAVQTGAAAAAVSRERLESLAGEYEMAPGLVVPVVMTAGALEIRLGPSPMPLVPRNDSVFVAEQLGADLTFTTDTAGRRILRGGPFGAGPKLPPRIVPTAAAAAKLAGRYRSEELDSWIDIRADGGRLEYRTRYQAWAPTRLIRPGVLLGAGAQFVVEEDRRGQVTGLVLNASRVLGVRFVKAP